jgi:hypothetical protein
MIECTKCGKDFLANSEFWERHYLKEGLAGRYCRCKECTRACDRARYQKPREWGRHSIHNKKAAGHVVDIDPEYIEKIWPKDNKCPLLEREFIIGIGILNKMSPTLDRIIPERGYIKGNVLIVSHLANRIMTDATVEQVRRVGKNMKKIRGV